MGIEVEETVTTTATCDRCGEEHVTEGDTSSGRPKHWGNLELKRHPYDFQGAPAARNDATALLCDTCCRFLEDWLAGEEVS